ncbi:MAG: BatD family protein [Proteobacteria bacterium]|nr:BatD family protein [Pseudomonadota bacterium]
MKNRIVPILMFLALLGAAPVWGAVSVTLEVDRAQVHMDDTVSLICRVTGSRDATTPVIANLDGFDAFPAGTGSRFQLINGQISTSMDHRYQLTPLRQGTFTIGPATVKVDGQIYTSNQVQIQVMEPQFQAGEDEAGDLFMKATLSADRGYPGQEVLYKLSVYSVHRAELTALSLPEVKGITLKQLQKPLRYGTTKNGRSYDVYEFTYALTATEPGAFDLPPARLQLTVYPPRRMPSGFGGVLNDDFFNMARGRDVSLASQGVSLTVLPFPEQGRPRDFSGLVGDFNLESGLNPKKVRAGESATLTVVIRGKGNVRLIPELSMPDLPGVKVYPDQSAFTEEVTNSGSIGEKTMKWALVPQKAGEYILPPLSVSFLNPGTGTYQTLTSKPFTLAVELGEENGVAGASGGPGPASDGKRKVAVVGEDILPIHESPEAVMPAAMPPWWVAALILFAPVLAAGGCRAWKHAARKRAGKARGAAAKKALKRFTGQVRAMEPRADDLLRTFNEFLVVRLGLDAASLTPGEAKKSLLAAGAPPEPVARAAGIMSNLEERVFAGRGWENDAALAGELTETARELDRALKRSRPRP